MLKPLVSNLLKIVDYQKEIPEPRTQGQGMAVGAAWQATAQRICPKSEDFLHLFRAHLKEIIRDNTRPFADTPRLAHTAQSTGYTASRRP